MSKSKFKYPFRVLSGFILLLLIFLSFSCFFKKNDNVKSTVAFNTSISGEETSKVLEHALEAVDKPISEIKFGKDTYHFYPDKTLEMFCYISNHDDVMVRTTFPIFNFSDLTINDQDSTFIFYERIIPFLIYNSKNISVKNVTVDCRDKKSKTFDLQISEDYLYEIRNGQIVFVKEYYEHRLGQTILYDPVRKAIAFNTEAYADIANGKKSAVKNKYIYKTDKRFKIQKIIGFENTLRIEQLKLGLIQFHGYTKKKLPTIGMVLTNKGGQSINRIAPALRVTHTSVFNGSNVNVHRSGGMGLVADNSLDLILDSFNVTTSKGRMVSTSADATHFVGCMGKVQLKNCVFKNQLDDATNVHGAYQEVVDILDEYSLGIKMRHSQQQGFQIGVKGDAIELVRLSRFFFSYNNLRIKEVKKLNGGYHIIKFNEKLPSEVKAGDLIENLDGYPYLLVENSTISSNRARGLLTSNPNKTIIRNNFLST